MTLIDSPKVDLKKKLKYDDMPDNPTPGTHVDRPTGEVESGSSIQGFHSPVQPDPAREGSASARKRVMSEHDAVNHGGHYIHNEEGPTAESYGHGVHKGPGGADDFVSAPTEDARRREAHVVKERKKKEERTASPSGRKTLREALNG